MQNFSQVSADPLFAVSRAILFRIDPEKAHDLALRTLARPMVKNWIRKKYRTDAAPVNCLGMQFDNAIGLAAGLDKNGDYIDALGALGFGHIEIGTVTPLAQAGNARPRIFRLTQHQALINRLGFNNKGVDHLVERVKKRTYAGKLGINIGKNAATALENAHEDYLICMKKVYPFADYITVNISSPNTVGLRDLQRGDHLKFLLGTLQDCRARLSSLHQRQVPLAVKIAPDLTEAELHDFCDQALQHEVDAIIVGNTSNQRDGVEGHVLADEAGGLSGRALLSRANDQLARVASRIGSKAALIGVGGVSCGQDARDKIQCGAGLVQIYSGLIYQGPSLIADCIRATSSDTRP